ncbi:MAG: thioredoxin [Oscillospiraceae bacterium]|nr:thioredoxin [Oscillospiraceae bacterium]
MAVPILRVALLVIGIGVLMYGFLSGGTADVLTKAINICTECVGLG